MQHNLIENILCIGVIEPSLVTFEARTLSDDYGVLSDGSPLKISKSTISLDLSPAPTVSVPGKGVTRSEGIDTREVHDQFKKLDASMKLCGNFKSDGSAIKVSFQGMKGLYCFLNISISQDAHGGGYLQCNFKLEMPL